MQLMLEEPLTTCTECETLNLVAADAKLSIMQLLEEYLTICTEYKT